MTQRRHTERKHAVDSYNLNASKQHIIPAGRYGGFDTIVSTAGLVLTLGHTATGAKNYTRDTHVLDGPLGKWVTRQGVTIEETASIGGLTFDTNAANAYARWDAIVGSHSYSDSVTGGTGATYSIVKGALGGPVKPVVADDSRDVILAYVKIPASAAVLTTISLEPAAVLGLGGEQVAKIDFPNRFTKMQQWFEKATHLNILSADIGGSRTRQYIELPDDGNIFAIDLNANTLIQGMTEKPLGTIVILRMTDTTRIVNGGMNSGERANGYMALYDEGSTTLNYRDLADNTLAMFLATGDSFLGTKTWSLIATTQTLAQIETILDAIDAISTEITTLQNYNTPQLKTTVLGIGAWNMTSTGSMAVPSSIPISSIRSVQVIIYNDAGTEAHMIGRPGIATASSYPEHEGYLEITVSNIMLYRRTGGFFAAGGFAAAAQRGFVTIQHT